MQWLHTIQQQGQQERSQVCACAAASNNMGVLLSLPCPLLTDLKVHQSSLACGSSTDSVGMGSCQLPYGGMVHPVAPCTLPLQFLGDKYPGIKLAHSLSTTDIWRAKIQSCSDTTSTSATNAAHRLYCPPVILPVLQPPAVLHQGRHVQCGAATAGATQARHQGPARHDTKTAAKATQRA